LREVQKTFGETPIGMTSALQRPHILIITDDPDLTDFLGEGLVYAGFWTSVIASALQTLEVFRLRSFDAIILDADLGGIGALELVRRLRGRSDRSPEDERTDIPILLISQPPGEMDPTEQLNLDVDAVISPPIELEDLAAVLNQIVAAWRMRRPGRPWADEAALRSS
jgi:DNA-binding response OmpR family regulator